MLADVAAATRVGWAETAEGWSGAGADGAAEFMSVTADAADRLSLRIDELRAGAIDAADAVARAHSRLRDIVARFEERAAAIEARLDEPGALDELREEARRALREATAVVDELQHRAGRTCRPRRDAGSSGRCLGRRSDGACRVRTARRPRCARRLRCTRGLGAPGGASSGLGPTQAELAALPLPDPEAFGEGVAVALPDGSTVDGSERGGSRCRSARVDTAWRPLRVGRHHTRGRAGLQRADAVGVSPSRAGPSAARTGAGPRCRRESECSATRRPCGVGRARCDGRRQRPDD